MELSEMSQQLLAAKKNKGVSFADLGNLINRDEVWVSALFYHQATASEEELEVLTIELGLEKKLFEGLTEYPIKGLGPLVPSDPLIYRFYEIMQIYGLPMKAVIQEKFGDGIMSAIDFTLNIDKLEDPKGDRVKVTMNGKFLPYKKW